jgi:CheY-like chemotaxis protein
MRPEERTAKVLAVDDREDNLLALEAVLQGLPLQTVAVTSGDAALKKLLTDDFALILLDAHMPDMDGFQTAQRIKQRERTRHIPIIFLTAVEYDAHLAYRGYEAGAVDYITKPFDPWVLRSKVAVFVDLWNAHAALAAEAAEHRRLHAAVEEALRLLSADPADTRRATDLLRQARSHAITRTRG